MVENLQFDNWVKNCTKNEVPLSLSIFCLMLEFVFGFNFGFNKSFDEQYRYIATVFRRFTCVIVILLFASLCVSRPAIMYWYGIYLAQYILYVIVQCSSKYYAYDFFVDIYKCNAEVKKKHVGAVSFFCFFITGFIKLVVCLLYCKFHRVLCEINAEKFIRKSIPEIVYCVTIWANDVVPTLQIIVFYHLYCCVKKLRYISENSFNTATLKKIYIDIEQCFENILPNYSRLLIVQLLADGPRLLIMVSSSLIFMKTQVSDLVVTEVVFVISTMINIGIPALIAESINSQMDAVKKVLHSKLVSDNSVEHSERNEDIVRLLRFIEAQPLKRRIYGVVPLDIRLPVALISLCTTYIIVIIQMTHVYD